MAFLLLFAAFSCKNPDKDTDTNIKSDKDKIPVAVDVTKEKREYQYTVAITKEIKEYKNPEYIIEDSLSSWEREEKKNKKIIKRDREKEKQLTQYLNKVYREYYRDPEKQKEYRDYFKKEIKAGANPDGFYFREENYIHEIVDRNDLELLTFLLEQGADPDVKTLRRNETALEIAVSREKTDIKIVEKLLEYGANIHLFGYEGTALFTATSYYNRFDIVKLLLDNGADINEQSMYGSESPLSQSAHNWRNKEDSDYKVAAYLIAQGAEYTNENETHYIIDAVGPGPMGPISYTGKIPKSVVMQFSHLKILTAVIRSIHFTDYLIIDHDCFRYHPVKIFDNNAATAWTVHPHLASGVHRIGIKLDRKIKIDAIQIDSGSFNKKLLDNNIITEIQIILDNTKRGYNLKKSESKQRISFNTIIEFKEFYLDIIDCYDDGDNNCPAIMNITFLLNNEPINLHTGKVKKYLKQNYSKTVYLEEIQEEIAASPHSSYKDKADNKPNVKLTLQHFKTLIISLHFPLQAVIWNDEDYNGIAEIGELVSLSKEHLKAVWDLSKKAGGDNGLSINDYHAAISNAIVNDQIDKVYLLLSQEVDINTNVYGVRLTNNIYIFGYLNIACAKGNIELIKYLLSKGADINNTDRGNPLSCALRANQKETVKFLIEKGADINRIWAILAAITNSDTDMVKYLIKKGADTTVIDRTGNDVILTSAKAGNLELLKYFVETGNSPHSVNNNGYNAIAHVCQENTKDGEAIFFYLIEQGVDPCIEINDNRSVLSMTVQNGWLKAVKYLIEEKKMEINIHDKDNASQLYPLNIAIRYKHKNIVTYLLEKGADPNIVINDQGPLMYCVQNLDVELTRLLIENGAKTNLYPKDAFSMVLESMQYHLNYSYDYYGEDPGNENNSHPDQPKIDEIKEILGI